MTEEEQVFITELWAEYYPFMVQRAMGLSIAKEDACDIAAECFLSLIRHRETLMEMAPEGVRAYVAVAIRNRCINWYTVRQRRKTLSLDTDTLPETALKDFDFENQVISRMDSQDQAALLARGLSQRDKMLLLSHYIEGQTDEEIAAQIQCSPNSVRALLSRAKKRAKKLLTKE